MKPGSALVTGSDGFVGRHFVRHLQQLGWEVVGVDLKSGLDCRETFKDCQRQFDLVVHLAAIVGGRLTIENQPIKVATDLELDSLLFNWAVDTKQPRIIYYSSSAAYPIVLQQFKPVYIMGSSRPRQICGRNGHRLIEDDIDLENIQNPDMTYGWAKLTGEMLAQYAEEQGVRVHVFRPFSGYGEDQDLDYPYPSFIKRAKERMDPFVIWGDGTQIRDFIHVDDIVAATMRAVDLDIQGPVNLGSGIPTSFNDLAYIIFHITGYQPQVVHMLDKPVGVEYRCADVTKLHSFYELQYSLERGIKLALDI